MRSIVFGFALLMVAVASCAEPPLEHGDRAVHYDNIDELVASADAVAIGRVADTSRGRVLDQDGLDGGVVVAEEQTAGRGRRGRTWLSPSGLNLMLSVALRPMLPARHAWQLGLATALATASACRSVAPVDLKWPNDVIAGGAKLAGILLETTMLDGGRCGPAVGIGPMKSDG